MPPFNDEIRDIAVTMIGEGLSSDKISARTGLSKRTIAEIRAHYTMGRYSIAPEETEHEVAEAVRLLLPLAVKP
jgi:hypothetical protein